ncbi:MAG: patatin-like phospholipase family protein [Jatrophihabitans sp.]
MSSALVLGGGGVLGFAWTVGALSAWQDHTGQNATDSALVVGTSAGSVLAALLGCRIPIEVIERHHQGVPLPADPAIDWDYNAESGGALPPRPGWRPGSPRLVLDAVRHPRSSSATVALSGLLPRGRGTLEPIHDMVAATSVECLPGQNWPTDPKVWIVGTDYESGKRVVFGRDDVSAILADAVCASCAIPAWYPPIEIDGRRFVDGGTASNASVDIVLPLVETGSITEVVIAAPMAAVDYDKPRSPVTRLERVVRRAITRGIETDAQQLRAAGADVTILAPSADDLEVMGPNLMNPRRRNEVLLTALRTTTELLERGGPAALLDEGAAADGSSS